MIFVVSADSDRSKIQQIETFQVVIGDFLDFRMY